MTDQRYQAPASERSLNPVLVQNVADRFGPLNGSRAHSAPCCRVPRGGFLSGVRASQIQAVETGTVASPSAPGEWDLDRIRQLVTQNDLERGRTEYKRELGNGRATLESIAALANTFGGMVLVGVDETKNGLGRLTGVVAGECDKLARRCSDQLVPPFSPQIIPIKLGRGDRYVLVVLVDPDHARRPVMLTQGNKVLVRVNGHNVTADWYRLRDLFAEQPASSLPTALPAEAGAAAPTGALGVGLASLGVETYRAIDTSGHPSALARAGEEYQAAQPTPGLRQVTRPSIEKHHDLITGGTGGDGQAEHVAAQKASPGAMAYPPVDTSGHPSAPTHEGEEHQAAQPTPAQKASAGAMANPPVDTSGHRSPPTQAGEDHQAAQPAPAQEASPAAMAEWVEGQQFSITGRRRGYDEDEVDAFLDAIRDTFLGERRPPLTSDEVRNIGFSGGKRRGYDEAEVDGFLDEVEKKLAAWPRPTA